MPVPGTKQKPAGQAVNRNKPVHEWIEVENVPFEGGPDLPDRPGGWCQAAVRKWDAWRRMPHAKLWTVTDWEFAFDAIELVAQWYDKGGASLATEIRNREKLLGTTMDYRRDLRIRYVDPQPENDVPAEVTRMDDYRDL